MTGSVKKKPEKIEELLEALVPSQGQAKETGTCPFCGKAIYGKASFRDPQSWREYTISGLCQECQDEVFG